MVLTSILDPFIYMRWVNDLKFNEVTKNLFAFCFKMKIEEKLWVKL